MLSQLRPGGDNLVYWIDSVRAAILAADPTALVVVGFFHPQQPNPARPGDPRLVSTAPAIAASKADIIDLHPYMGIDLTLPQFVENYGMPPVSAKPIIMGEFGAVKPSYQSAEAGAARLQQWQIDSCGYGFSGWLLWSWDVEDQPDVNLWSALSAGGVINAALRPLSRPDPCRPGSYLNQDLAARATMTASSSASGSSPALAVDGLPNTAWSASAFSPQWIQIDLPAPSIVTGVRLTVSQYPNGPTVHDLYVQRQGDGQPQLVKEFSGTTQDQQVLAWTANQPLTGVTSIRVATVTSPSWVSWREIEVLSGDSGMPTISSVVNGASFAAAVTPGSWVTIQGTGLAASTRHWQAADFNGAKLPSVLDGVKVSIDGAAAAVYYISPGQLNVQAPDSIHTGQTVAVTVTRDSV
jgi:hypothetical protein